MFSFEFCAQATNRDGPRREDLQFLSRPLSLLGILLHRAVSSLAVLDLRPSEVPSSRSTSNSMVMILVHVLVRIHRDSSWDSVPFTSSHRSFTVFTNTKSCEKQTGVRFTSLSVLQVPFPPASGCSACVCPGLCTLAVHAAPASLAVQRCAAARSAPAS